MFSAAGPAARSGEKSCLYGKDFSIRFNFKHLLIFAHNNKH